MPCLAALLAIFFPRLAIFLIWLFAPSFFGPAFDGSFLWLALGFVFLPLTTLVYAFAFDGGGVAGFGLVAVIIAVLADLGLLGGSARGRW